MPSYPDETPPGQAVRDPVSAPPRPDARPRPPGPEDRRGTTSTTPNAPEPPPGPPKVTDHMRRPNFWIIFLVLLVINWLVIPWLFPEPSDRLNVSYTFFKQQVAAGNVPEITAQGDEVQGTFKAPVASPSATPNAAATPSSTATTAAGNKTRTYTKFDTHIPTFADNQSLDQLLESHNVQIDAKPLDEGRSGWLTALLSFGPTLLLIGAFLWLSQRAASSAGGGVFGLGRSRARRYEATADTKPITFDDVAGIDEVENELVEVVDFLKQPAKYQRLGGTVPKGVLLVGPPGTGKTLLARAVAGEAGVPFFSISGSEFIEMIVGVGASRVRDLFAEAKQAAPCIIFVDELDAIGRRRGAGNVMGGNDEREQTLNQLLVEMDGFNARQAVIVLAATNRADVLDPALLRPGRFDRRVAVYPPDRAGRAAILRVHTRTVPLASDVDLDQVAAETPGFVGADLRNLVNEAALLAARKARNAVARDDFAEALEKIALGTARRIALDPEERRRVAYHESGHALVGLLQPHGDPVRRVTVVPRGQALGVTLSVPDMDRYNLSEDYLRARITSALGGRAAEQVVYGSMTTGAENDLRQVTDLARAMVTRWGMSKEIGLVALASADEGNFLERGVLPGQERPYSDETAQAVDQATRRIVDECYSQAIDDLTRERPRLEALTEALLRDESLDEAQMREATGLVRGPAPSPAALAR